METKPTWSFSSIKTFNQCPKKYYHTKIAKDYKEDFNTKSILYGNLFHEAAEEYVGGKVETLDPRFDFTQSALDKLKSMEGEKLCEYKMGLTANLEPCGFFDKDVWFRGVSDLNIVKRERDIAQTRERSSEISAKYERQ